MMNTALQQLIEYAKNEDWESMDKGIPSLCNDNEVISWSLELGITDENGNIRDLAVSLLEKSDYTLTEEDKTKLMELMGNDKNIYVQFRAAFTLFNREYRSSEVLSKMQQALEDTDVQEIAKSYLQ